MKLFALLSFLVATGTALVVDIDMDAVAFLAGQHIIAGTIDLLGDETELCVTYNTVDGWYIKQTHLWIGTDHADVPSNNAGNPQVGHFPYKDTFADPYPTSHTVCIPWTDLFEDGDPCNHEVLIAAHAVVEKDLGGGSLQEETAWANGTQIGQQWGMCFGVSITCPPPVRVCQIYDVTGASMGNAANLNGDYWNTCIQTCITCTGADGEQWMVYKNQKGVGWYLFYMNSESRWAIGTTACGDMTTVVAYLDTTEEHLEVVDMSDWMELVGGNFGVSDILATCVKR